MKPEVGGEEGCGLEGGQVIRISFKGTRSHSLKRIEWFRKTCNLFLEATANGTVSKVTEEILGKMRLKKESIIQLSELSDSDDSLEDESNEFMEDSSEEFDDQIDKSDSLFLQKAMGAVNGEDEESIAAKLENNSQVFFDPTKKKLKKMSIASASSSHIPIPSLRVSFFFNFSFRAEKKLKTKKNYRRRGFQTCKYWRMM